MRPLITGSTWPFSDFSTSPRLSRCPVNATVLNRPARACRVFGWRVVVPNLNLSITMEYKKNMKLAQTGFPMKADLIAREPQRLQQWQAAKLYQKIQAARAGATKFVLHDGPPFANGDVHIGTALNKILKDIIVKHQGLLGRDAPYVPGWDCHGLPIEFRSEERRVRKE